MKIVHLLNGFGTGGMEKGVATIIRNASSDFEHVVFCLTRSGPSERLLPSGVPVVEIGKRPGHSPRDFWRLVRALKMQRPQVVHTRNWGGFDGVIACRLAGIRRVIHGEHGWVMDDPFGRSPRRLRIRRFLDRWIREYTCVSKEMERWLRSTVGIRKPVTQIYNGIDTDHYAPTIAPGPIRRELALDDDSFVVTICGRLDPIKDHVTIFRACDLVREQGAEAVLLVVGDGPESERLKREAGGNTLFLGNRDDVADILRETDVFALPSLNEGISNTILEAMASGIPVVATDVGGNPELVKRDVTGILVPPSDPGAIAVALLDYLRDPGRRKRHGDAGRRRVLQEFSVGDMVAAYEATYRRLGDQGIGGAGAAR